MKFYAYLGNEPLGSERLGTEGKMLFERASVRLAHKFARKVAKGKAYMLYSYTNLYKNDTFQHHPRYKKVRT